MRFRCGHNSASSRRYQPFDHRSDTAGPGGMTVRSLARLFTLAIPGPLASSIGDAPRTVFPDDLNSI